MLCVSDVSAVIKGEGLPTLQFALNLSGVEEVLAVRLVRHMRHLPAQLVQRLLQHHAAVL